MKKLTVLLVSLVALSSLSLLAGPPTGGWRNSKKLSTVEDFSALKPGDQVVQVCTKCDTVSTAEIESTDQAMAFFKEGGTLKCPSCGNIAKVRRIGPPAKNKQAVSFVDDHGESCMFMAQLDSKQEDEGVHHHKKP